MTDVATDIVLILPDGTQKQVPAGTTGMQIATSISRGLAKNAVGVKLGDDLLDLDRPLEHGGPFRIITADDADPDALYLARHSAAHVMAEAICAHFPDAKLVYGPPVENGFYYDIDCPTPIRSDDFSKIEAEIAKIIKENRRFTRYSMDRESGFGKLRQEANPYKIDNAERAQGELSFYATGEPGKNWEDLCRGPHVPSTGFLGAVKLTSVAGAYYRGDANLQQLQRVYGKAYFKKAALEAELKREEEARKRDHRVLGKQLGLFTLSDAVGPGLVLWMPKGALLRQTLEDWLKVELRRGGYFPVYTPHIGRLELYRTSGHFPYYAESQFPPLYENDASKHLNRAYLNVGKDPGAVQSAMAEATAVSPHLAKLAAAVQAAGDDAKPVIRDQLIMYDDYLLKPMNCPHHIQIYKAEKRSYRDLPVRLAEFGTVYRHEQSGELNGMTRVRGFTQDDAHLFCTPEQLENELERTVELVRHVFRTLGLADFRVRFGKRDPDSTKYTGSADLWDRAEGNIRNVLTRMNLPFSEEAGEAAFYGPKIDFVVRDVIGREWQLGTVQVDYNLPQRFELEYVGQDNQTHRPVMIHRAPFGSMERFCGILIEHYAGHFPLWLSPVQVVILTVSEQFEPYAREVAEALKAHDLRTELDDGPDRIGAKIRNAQLAKTPLMLVIGEKESSSRTVSMRHATGGQGTMGLTEFVSGVVAAVASRQGDSELKIRLQLGSNPEPS